MTSYYDRNLWAKKDNYYKKKINNNSTNKVVFYPSNIQFNNSNTNCGKICKYNSNSESTKFKSSFSSDTKFSSDSSSESIFCNNIKNSDKHKHKLNCVNELSDSFTDIHCVHKPSKSNDYNNHNNHNNHCNYNNHNNNLNEEIIKLNKEICDLKHKVRELTCNNNIDICNIVEIKNLDIKGHFVIYQTEDILNFIYSNTTNITIKDLIGEIHVDTNCLIDIDNIFGNITIINIDNGNLYNGLICYENNKIKYVLSSRPVIPLNICMKVKIYIDFKII